MMIRGLWAVISKGFSQLQRCPWFWALLLWPWCKSSHLWPWGQERNIRPSPYQPCSCLTTCLSRSWGVGSQVTGARGTDHSGFFLLDRGIVGSWVPVPALCQGASAQGLESPQNDRTACSNVFTSWYPCCNSIWGFHLLSSRKK